jgi:hypothetical protein
MIFEFDTHLKKLVTNAIGFLEVFSCAGGGAI